MTPFNLTSLTQLRTHRHDTIIDVRAPSEFAQDHIPGAINLPVLTDAQRAEVGTIYTQDSPFKARKIGAALVAQNTAQHLQGPLSGYEGDWQPLVYCWRGGQRSGSFATILDQIGWRVHLLQGGYRTYRRLVVASLYDTPLPHRLILIDGGTGTAKTALLDHLNSIGAQTLDLEQLAHHRGSLFGATEDTQPSQKTFESAISQTLSDLDPTRITWVEAESSKIGDRFIPPALWTHMTAALRIRIEAPLSARAAFLCSAYGDLTTNTKHLTGLIDQLRPYHSADRIADWHHFAETGNWPALAESLIADHYDPRYAKSATSKPAPETVLSLADLTPATLASTAQHLTRQFS